MAEEYTYTPSPELQALMGDGSGVDEDSTIEDSYTYTPSPELQALMGGPDTEDTQDSEEWEWKPFERMRETSVGFVSDMSNLAALTVNKFGNRFMQDTDVDEKVSSWFIDKAERMAEDNASLDLQHTSFQEAVSDPVLFGKFVAEGVTATIPDLVAAALTGGATAGASATRLGLGTVGRLGAKAAAKKYAKDVGTKEISKAVQKEFKDKLQKYTIKEMMDNSADVALSNAYKQASKELGRKLGVMSYMGMRGSSMAASQDIELNGLDDASLGAAVLVGMGYAGLATMGPVDMALAGKFGSTIGKKVLFTTPLKEGLQEVSEGALDNLHLAGIDTNRTVGDVFSDPKTLYDMAGAGVIGAVVGAPVGVVEYGVNKPTTAAVPTDEEASAILEEHGIDPDTGDTVDTQVAKEPDERLEDTATKEAVAQFFDQAFGTIETEPEEKLQLEKDVVPVEQEPEVEIKEPQATEEDQKIWKDTTEKASKVLDEKAREDFKQWANGVDLNTKDNVESEAIAQVATTVAELDNTTNIRDRKAAVDKIKKLTKAIKDVTPEVKEKTAIGEAQASVAPTTKFAGKGDVAIETTPEDELISKEEVKKQEEIKKEPEVEIKPEEVEKAADDPIVTGILNNDPKAIFSYLNEKVQKGSYTKKIEQSLRAIADMGLTPDMEVMDEFMSNAKEIIRIADKIKKGRKLTEKEQAFTGPLPTKGAKGKQKITGPTLTDKIVEENKRLKRERELAADKESKKPSEVRKVKLSKEEEAELLKRKEKKKASKVEQEVKEEFDSSERELAPPMSPKEFLAAEKEMKQMADEALLEKRILDDQIRRGVNVSTKDSKRADAKAYTRIQRYKSFIQKNQLLYNSLVRKKGDKAPPSKGKTFYGELQATNAYDTLVYTRNNSTGLNKVLSGLLLRFVNNKKLQSIPVQKAPDNAETSYFSGDTVYIKDFQANSPQTYLHEVVHSITVREMAENPALKAEVTALLKVVRRYAKNNGKVSEDAWTAIQKARGNATDYHNLAPKGGNSLSYGLVNEKEFLAQALSSKSFQDFLKGIKVEQDTGYTSLWDLIVHIFRKAIGSTAGQFNALEKALTLTVDLAKVDTTGKLSTVQDQMFASEGAEVKPSKALAEEMQKKGEDPETIWKKTGWYLSPLDNAWRFEIDDSKATLSDIFMLDEQMSREIGEKSISMLEDYLDHPELYKAYPELKTYSVILEDRIDKNYQGLFRGVTQSIQLNLGRIKSMEEAKSTLLHEIQHAVQDMEALDSGASPEEMRPYHIKAALMANSEKLYNSLSTLGKSIIDSKVKDEGLSKEDAVHQFFLDTKGAVEQANRGKDIDTEGYDTSMLVPLAKTDKNVFGIHLIIKDLQNYAYATKLGEMEAEDVADRSDFTEAVRKDNYPYAYSGFKGVMKPWAEGDVTYPTALDEVEDLTGLAERTIDPAPPAPQVKRRKRKLTPEEIEAKHQEGIKRYMDYSESYGERGKNYLDTLGSMFTKAIRGITDILNEVHPELAFRIRKMEEQIRRKVKKRHDDVVNFIKGVEGIKDKKLKTEVYFYLLNSTKEDVKKRHELLEKAGLTKEYKKLRFMLDKINNEAKAVGLDHYKDIDEYIPRVVLKPSKLIQAMKDDGNYGILQAAVDEHLRMNGKVDVTNDDVAQGVTELLKTGKWPMGLREPRSSKKRTVNRVLSKYMVHYAKPTDAIISHIYDMTDAIEGRRFIGASRRPQWIKQSRKLYTKLQKTKDLDQRDLIINQIDSLYTLINNKEEEIKNSVARFLATLASEDKKFKLDAEKQAMATQAIRARLNQRGMGGPMQDIRNLGLITSLGGFSSTMTQMNDVVHSIHEYGLVNTVGSIFSNKTFTIDDMDLGHVMTELSSTPTSRWVDKILSITLFKKLDGAMKATTMEAAIRKHSRMVQTKNGEAKFRKKYGQEFGTDIDNIVEALKNPDKNNKWLRIFAFTELSKIQPVSMSEMPIGYNSGGNARIFYTLKTYNIKIANRIINKVRTVWANPNSTKAERSAAAYDLGKYMVLLTLAGASVDGLKNYLAGEDEPFEDVVWDNLMKLFFLSRYTMDKGFREGFMSTILKDVLMPPLDIIDAPVTDVVNWFYKGKGFDESHKIITLFPLIGKKPIYSNRFGLALPSEESKRITKNRGYLIDEIKEADSMGEVRSRIREYNKVAREFNKSLDRDDKEKFKVSPIDAKAIRRARKKEREKRR